MERYPQNYAPGPIDNSRPYTSNQDPRYSDSRPLYNDSRDRRPDFTNDRSIPPMGYQPAPYNNTPNASIPNQYLNQYPNNPANVNPNNPGYYPGNSASPYSTGYSGQFTGDPRGQNYPKDPYPPAGVPEQSYSSKFPSNPSSIPPNNPNYPIYNPNYQGNYPPNQVYNPAHPGPQYNYPNQFQGTPGYSTGFQNRPLQSELEKNTSYNFHKALNENITGEVKKSDNQAIEIRQPTRQQLDEADVLLSQHPMNKIMIDIGLSLLNQNVNLDALFTEADPDVKEVVKKRDFIDILGRKCGLIRMSVVSSNEIEEIADILDFYKNSLVYYKEFCKKVKNSEYRLGGPELPKKIDPEWRERTYKNIADVVILKKIDINDVFKRYDSRNTGQLRVVDFQQAFQAIPTKLNPQEILQLADEFDPRHEGLIAYQRFINNLDSFVIKKKTFEDTVKRLENFCIEKNINFESKIQAVDPRDTKILTKDDFLSVLNKINFTVSFAESQALCEEIPKSKEGFLDLRYLLARIPKPRPELDVQKIYERINKYIKSSKQTITQAFAKFDKNGDGNLGPYEFSQALTQMGLSDLTASEITVLIQDLDKDKDGQVSVLEFADKLGMPIDLVQTTVSYDFFRKINRFLKNRGQTLQEYFLQYDNDRNNSLNKPELSRMLAMLNLDLDTMEIEKLFNEMDANHDGRVTFMEFSLKYDKAIAAIEKKDDLNKNKLIRALKGKHPKDIFKSRFDPDTNQDIFPVSELKQGIKLLSLNFTDNDINYLVDEIVQNKNHADISDLSKYFSMQAPQVVKKPVSARPHWADKWIKQIKQTCVHDRCSVQAFFSKYCRDSSGKMTMAELGAALDEATTNMKPEEQVKLGNELRKDNGIYIKDLVSLIEGSNTNNLEYIIEDLKNYFVSTNRTLEEVFRVNKSGDIYRPELAEGLASIKFDLDLTQLTDLMVYLNPDIKNLSITNHSLQKVSAISLENLLKLNRKTLERRGTIVSSRLVEQKIIQGVYNTLAEHITNKKININRLIAQYDTNGSNKLSTEDFHRLIDEISNRSMPIEHFKLVLAESDPGNTGTVKYQNFLSRIEEGIVYNSFSQRLLSNLNKDINDKNITLTKLFKDPSGYATFQEIFEGLNKASVSVDREELKRLLAGIDTDENGKISYKELIHKIHSAGGIGKPSEEFKKDRFDYREESKYFYGADKKYERFDRPEFKDDYRNTADYKIPEPDYRKPSPGYRNPSPDYKNPGIDYGTHDRDYRDPSPGYKNPPDYRVPGPDYKSPGESYRNSEKDYSNLGDYRKPDQDYKVPIDYRNPVDQRYPGQDYRKPGQDYSIPERDYKGTVDYRQSAPEYNKPDYRNPVDYRYPDQNYRKPGQDYSIPDPDYKLPADSRALDYDPKKPGQDYRSVTESRTVSQGYMTPGQDYRKAGSDYMNPNDYQKSSSMYRSTTNEFRTDSLDYKPNYRNEEPRRDPYSRSGTDYDPRSEDRKSPSPRSRTQARPLRGPKQHWAKSYIQIIQEYIQKRQCSVKQIFQEFDLDKSNSLTSFEFAKALDSMGVQLSQGELQILMEELDLNHDGRVSLLEFENIIGKREIDERLEQKLEEFREFVKRERIDLRKFFLVADRDRNNYLDYNEFIREVGSLYRNWSRYDLEDLARYLDLNHDGRILYHEFIGRIMIEEVEGLNKIVADYVRKNGIDIEAVLRELDYRSDKCLHFDQFLQALEKIKIPLNREEIIRLLLENPLHRTRDNRLSYTDLLERLPLLDEISKIYDQLRKTFSDKITKVNEVFEKYNVNNEKALTYKMFYEAYSFLGGNLRPSDYTKLIDSLPKTKDEKIYYKEFLKKLKVKKPGIIDVYKTLKREIQSKNLNFMDQLRAYDTYNLKMISKSQLKEIFKSNSIPVVDEDIEFIWSEFDKSNSGLINYEELFKRIHPKYEPPKGPKTVVVSKEPHWAQMYLDSIQQYLKASNMRIKDLFEKFDTDHSNSVSPQEFIDALRDIRTNIPYQDMQRLIDELVSKQSGQISLSSFEKLFPELMQQEKTLDRLYYLIRKAISDKRIDLKNLLFSKDREMQGFISAADFIDCIKQISDFSVPELRLIGDTFDPRRTNQVYYQDFIKKIELGGIELINMKVKEYITSSRRSFVKPFEPILKNDYFLPAGSIRTVLESLQLPLMPEEIAQLIHDNNLGRSEDGRLSVKDLADRIGIRELFPEPKPTASLIYEKLRKRWQDNRIDPINIFKQFDYEKDMNLTKVNFSQALVYGGCPLTDVEINVVWELLDKLPDGRASVQHFIRLVNGIDTSTDTVYLKIYNFCDQNRIDLGNVLNRFDVDNDRQISMFELENGFKTIKLMLTDSEYRGIYNEMDRGRTGKIFINDFIRRVMRDAPQIDLNAVQWAAPIFSSMSRSLYDFKLDAVTYFRRYNIDKDGLISLQDFRDAIYKLGIDPASSQSQRLINYFKLPNRDSIKFKELEYALKSLGRFDPVPNKQPMPMNVRFRVLSPRDLEECYGCLDYISDMIKKKKVTIEVYVQKRFTENIVYDDIKRMIVVDLNTPDADEGLIENLCLLLDCGRGYVTKIRLIDALSSVRIEQVLPDSLNRDKQANPLLSTSGFQGANRPDPTGYQSSNTKGILKPATSVPNSLRALYEFLNNKKITLSSLLGKDSGANFPKSSFIKAIKNENILNDKETNELLAVISVQGDRVDLSKLSSMLSDLNKPSVRMDPYLLFSESLRDQRVTLAKLFGNSSSVHRDVFAKTVAFLKLDPGVFNTILIECKAADPLQIDLKYLSSRLEGRDPSNPFQRPNSSNPDNRVPNSLAPNSRLPTNMNPNNRPAANSRIPTDPIEALLAQLNAELLRQGVSAEDLFSKYDLDDDGSLTLNEFIQGFKSMRTSVPDEKLRQAFEALDSNKNSSLSINEIAARIPGARVDIRLRINQLDLGQRFEEEVKQVFDMLDKDKDGSIDYNEIALGIKAYCIIPSQSQTKDLMNKIDKNNNGKIEYEEFKSFVEETVKKQVLDQEDDMQDLRQKFVEADLMKVGYLTPEQLFDILRSTKADITHEELVYLISYADANHDGKIDIDEFMLLMTNASPEVFADPKASAVMFNIRKSRKMSPLDFFKMFQGMPQHFLPSFISESHKLKKNLQSSDIVPTLDSTGLLFKDVIPIAAQSKLNSLTYLKQNPVKAGGYITLELASGISIPDSSIVQRNCILKRFVRVTHWNSLTQKFLGNSIHLEAQWRENLEDRWVFELPSDKECNIIAVKVGPDQDIMKIFLVFEFVIVFSKENNPIEMSCGFSKVMYNELVSKTAHKIPISGGTPDNEQAINPNDIRTFRTGWRHALKMTGLSKVGSFLQFSIKLSVKCTPIEIGSLEAMPEVSVMNKKGLTIVRLYREYLAQLISKGSGKTFALPNVADSFLTQFPKVLDCPDTWNQLLNYWNSAEFSNLLSRDRNDSNYLAHLQGMVNRLYSVMHTEDFALDNHQPTKFSFGIPMDKSDLYSKRVDLITKALKNIQDNKSVSHKPFDINEIASKKLIDTDLLMSKKVRSMSKKLETTASTGFNQDSRNFRTSLNK